MELITQVDGFLETEISARRCSRPPPSCPAVPMAARTVALATWSSVIRSIYSVRRADAGGGLCGEEHLKALAGRNLSMHTCPGTRRYRRAYSHGLLLGRHQRPCRG